MDLTMYFHQLTFYFIMRYYQFINLKEQRETDRE